MNILILNALILFFQAKQDPFLLLLSSTTASCCQCLACRPS